MEGCLIFMHPCLHRMENILRLRIAVLIIYIFMMQKRIKKFSSGKHRDYEPKVGDIIFAFLIGKATVKQRRYRGV